MRIISKIQLKQIQRDLRWKGIFVAFPLCYRNFSEGFIYHHNFCSKLIFLFRQTFLRFVCFRCFVTWEWNCTHRHSITPHNYNRQMRRSHRPIILSSSSCQWQLQRHGDMWDQNRNWFDVDKSLTSAGILYFITLPSPLMEPLWADAFGKEAAHSIGVTAAYLLLPQSTISMSISCDIWYLMWSSIIGIYQITKS